MDTSKCSDLVENREAHPLCTAYSDLSLSRCAGSSDDMHVWCALPILCSMVPKISSSFVSMNSLGSPGLMIETLLASINLYLNSLWSIAPIAVPEAVYVTPYG